MFKKYIDSIIIIMISANRTIQNPRHFIFSKDIGDKNYGITIFPGHSYHVLVVPNKCPESTLLGIMDKNHYKKIGRAHV